MEIFWILVGLFAFMTLAFLAIALLFPELVGITGKVAKKIQEHQHGDQQD